jgi:uncharacterized membrane protein
MRILFMLMLLAFPVTAMCQEVFVDHADNKTNLFLGAINGDRLKVLEGGTIKWKSSQRLEQRDLLSSMDFLSAIFDNDLRFILEGDEPFWRVSVTKDELSIVDYETGQSKTLEIMVYLAGRDMNPRFYFMFKTAGGDVFGVVNYVGWNPRSQQQCECNLSEEISLYETCVCIDGEIYRGCARIEKLEE